MSNRVPWRGGLTIVTLQNAQASLRYTLRPQPLEHPGKYQVGRVHIDKEFDAVGIYISRKLQGPKLNEILLTIRMKTHAPNVLMGDLNARTTLWSTRTDRRGAAVSSFCGNSTYSTFAPSERTFHSRGQSESQSMIDLFIKNINTRLHPCILKG